MKIWEVVTTIVIILMIIVFSFTCGVYYTFAHQIVHASPLFHNIYHAKIFGLNYTYYADPNEFPLPQD